MYSYTRRHKQIYVTLIIQEKQSFTKHNYKINARFFTVAIPQEITLITSYAFTFDANKIESRKVETARRITTFLKLLTRNWQQEFR